MIFCFKIGQLIRRLHPLALSLQPFGTLIDPCLMYAVLYSDVTRLEQLLKEGADPNARNNDAKATALMWAATDLEKTRVLLAHNAEVNARSDDLRTPLKIAAGRPGGAHCQTIARSWRRPESGDSRVPARGGGHCRRC